MNYKLKVLSPLHIGCGEEYNALSYLMDPRKNPPQLSILNEDLIFEMLKDGQIKSFVAWLENERFPNLFYFFKNVLRDTNFSLQNKLRQKAIYTIPNYAGHEKLRDIKSFIKEMNHPYIPGTEIKGAIRTAVLYCSLLDNEELFVWLKDRFNQFQRNNADKINEVKNKTKPNTKIKNELVKEMARIESAFQEQVLCCKPKDAKYDVMKYLQISDSELLNADKSLAVSYVKPFNINNIFSVFYEYIKPGTEIGLSTLALENEKSLKTKLDNMGFTDKQKKIVSGIDAIFNSCCRFSNDLLDEEISFFSKQDNKKFQSLEGKLRIINHLNEIKSQNKPESPVLRIGKDEGYNSLTVGLAVKKTDSDLYENVLIHATKNKSYDSNHGGPMPKSRKIVYWNGEETTAGWVQLIPENISESQTNIKNNSDNQAGQGYKPATSEDLSKLQGMFNVKVKRK
ncbi:MAG: type III-A CRISPR-associated RAMP protein Csm5 [Proteobacteria bacterium]|nr:type III-A CRISPR-associated RAMP protein Csm5 [Pseudomonadota bacterium]